MESAAVDDMLDRDTFSCNQFNAQINQHEQVNECTNARRQTRTSWTVGTVVHLTLKCWHGSKIIHNTHDPCSSFAVCRVLYLQVALSLCCAVVSKGEIGRKEIEKKKQSGEKEAGTAATTHRKRKPRMQCAVCVSVVGCVTKSPRMLCGIVISPLKCSSLSLCLSFAHSTPDRPAAAPRIIPHPQQDSTCIHTCTNTIIERMQHLKSAGAAM